MLLHFDEETHLRKRRVCVLATINLVYEILGEDSFSLDVFEEFSLLDGLVGVLEFFFFLSFAICFLDMFLPKLLRIIQFFPHEVLISLELIIHSY